MVAASEGGSCIAPQGDDRWERIRVRARWMVATDAPKARTARSWPRRFTTRLRVAALLTLGALVSLPLFHREGLWLEILLLFAGYVAGAAGIGALCRRLGRREVEAVCMLLLDVTAVTVGLWRVEALHTPAAGLYAPVIAIETLLAGPRRGAAAAAATLALYAAALVLSAWGAAPDGPATDLTATQAGRAAFSFIAVMVVAAVVFAISAMSRDFGRRRVASAEQRYRAIFEAAGDGISVVDPETGRFVDANASALAFMGLTLEELRARGLWELIPLSEHDQLRQLLERSTDRPRIHLGVRRFERADGTGRYIDSSLAGVRIGRQRRIVLISQDVTERTERSRARDREAEILEFQVAERTRDLESVNEELRELQVRLIEAERLAAAGELAGGIAHAINNPLAVLIGTVQMRIESSEPPDPLDEQILKIARRIAGVVSGMLNFSRTGELRPSWVRPELLLQDVSDELDSRAKEARVRFRIGVAPETPSLYVDRELLMAALVCVAENALDATPPGGEVGLEADVAAGGRVIEIGVTDRGEGVAEELRERIFEPFFSTKRAGSGLGLVIAQGIVHGHGGRIHFEARGGPGTRVEIEIPAWAEPEADAETG
jgi:PAS domain S-box-containing protein